MPLRTSLVCRRDGGGSKLLRHPPQKIDLIENESECPVRLLALDDSLAVLEELPLDAGQRVADWQPPTGTTMIAGLCEGDCRMTGKTVKVTFYIPIVSTDMTERIIERSVGRGGQNGEEDVREIQRVLNEIPPDLGGPKTPLEVDGIAGDKTTGAIQQLQLRQFGWRLADGRVDPAGPTLEKLNELAHTLAVGETPMEPSDS